MLTVEQFGAKSNESDAEEAENLFEFNLTKMDENDDKETKSINTEIVIVQDDYKQENVSNSNGLLQNKNIVKVDDEKHSTLHPSTSKTELSTGENDVTNPSGAETLNKT